MESSLLKSGSMAFLINFTAANTAIAGDDLSLVKAMGSLQYFAHKTSLAIDKKNMKLASFYAHEIEEIIETIENIEEFKGYPISELVKNKLKPPFEKFEGALKNSDWSNINKQFNQMIDGCNLCHTATHHEFIKIERPGVNNFMQSFDIVN